MTTRRDTLRMLAGAAVGAALPRALFAAGASGRRTLDGIGIQLYTLRAEMRRDPEATIARIATLGFRDVEWWGDWGRTPAQLRGLLDRHGLRSPAAHIDPRDLAPDRLPALLERAEAMGHRTLIVAWTPPNQRGADDVKRLGALLSAAGRSAARAGIRTGYHNHDFEFTRLGDRTLLDLLLDASDPAVVDLELDCYWAFKAGHDPLAMLRRHPDRIALLHLKDSAGPPTHRMVDVGAGVIDWRAVLDEATARRVRHVFVEHDEPADAWASASAGLGHLRALGY